MLSHPFIVSHWEEIEMRELMPKYIFALAPVTWEWKKVIAILRVILLSALSFDMSCCYFWYLPINWKIGTFTLPRWCNYEILLFSWPLTFITIITESHYRIWFIHYHHIEFLWTTTGVDYDDVIIAPIYHFHITNYRNNSRPDEWISSEI